MATKHTLLIVDDEPQILKAYSARLAQDYRVLTAEGAEDALQIFNREDIHIVLTDQRMPVVSGVGFLRRLRTEHPDTVRLLWTGFQDLVGKWGHRKFICAKGRKRDSANYFANRQNNLRCRVFIVSFSSRRRSTGSLSHFL